jgi:hypothetical protein
MAFSHRKDKDSMLTITSAKRIILLLISLNVVTILTAVTIFSSGMHIANANSTPPNCTFKNSQLVKVSLDGSYSGQLDNDAGKVLSSFKLKFTTQGDGAVIPTAFSATPVASTSTPVSTSKGGGLGMSLGGGSISDGSATEVKRIFTISTTDKSDNPDKKGNPVIIQFQILSGSTQSANGTWAVTNTGSTYDTFAGLFTLKKSGS